MLKRRIDIPEFGDQSWLRGWVQEAYRDCLNLALKVGGQYREMHVPFTRWAEEAGHREVLEIATGGGGPTDTMLQHARSAGVTMPKIVLSDWRPAVDEYRRLQTEHGAEQLAFIGEPVSALDVSGSTPEMRAICSAFHHFTAKEAQEIVADSLRDGDGLFIMEPFLRDLRHFFMMVLCGPFVYMAAPFTAPRKTFGKFAICTLFPIVPLMVMIDGCISILRVHTADEIAEMVPTEERDSVEVETGSFRYMGLFRSFYVAIRRQRPPDANGPG